MADDYRIEPETDDMRSDMDVLIQQMEHETNELLGVQLGSGNLNIRGRGSINFAALYQMQVVGCISIRPLFMAGDDHAHTCLIYALFVTRDHRHKGIATRLLRTADQYCAQNGIPNLYLTVHEVNNAALKLYDRLGFKVYTKTLQKPVDQVSQHLLQ